MKFNIYHPQDGTMNHDCIIGFIYARIDTVEAESLGHAFALSQNDFNEEYSKLGVRSTSVGDLIQEENGQCYFIKGMGFEKISVAELFGKYLITTGDTEEPVTSIFFTDNVDDIIDDQLSAFETESPE